MLTINTIIFFLRKNKLLQSALFTHFTGKVKYIVANNGAYLFKNLQIFTFCKFI